MPSEEEYGEYVPYSSVSIVSSAGLMILQTNDRILCQMIQSQQKKL